MARRRLTVIAVLATAAVLGVAPGALGDASGKLSAGEVCSRLRASSGKLRLGAHRKRLTVLAAGDSMIYPIDQVLGIAAPRGMHVIPARHDGTGLTTPAFDWHKLANQQAKKFHPDATVISLGGRDGGLPLPDAHHHLVECCGASWLGLYANLVRPLVRSYARAGRGRIYWLLLPAPRERLRAPLYEAVNNTLALLASEFPATLRLIPVDTAITPGYLFQETITYEGLQIEPRTPDGIHLNHEGACVERSLVVGAMRADGLLR